MRIIFTGSGEFGVPTLKTLVDAGHTIFPYTQPGRPAGRGRKLSPTPIARFAQERGIKTIEAENFNAEKLPDADLMVVIAFGQKISPAQVSHPRLGSINLHASILPMFRGAAPINWAIISGQTHTGNSVIRLAAKMDAGAILAQSSITIGQTETAGELHDRLAIDGVELVARVVGELNEGRANEAAQDESHATQAPKLTRQSATIDWNSPADQISRKIRGMYPWPGCRVRLLDAAGTETARLTLVRARAADGEGPRWHPGEIAADGHIACGNRAVEVREIQPDGRRPMTLPEYRRGNPWMPGMKLQSV